MFPEEGTTTILPTSTWPHATLLISNLQRRAFLAELPGLAYTKPKCPQDFWFQKWSLLKTWAPSIESWLESAVNEVLTYQLPVRYHQLPWHIMSRPIHDAKLVFIVHGESFHVERIDNVSIDRCFPEYQPTTDDPGNLYSSQVAPKRGMFRTCLKKNFSLYWPIRSTTMHY